MSIHPAELCAMLECLLGDRHVAVYGLTCQALLDPFFLQENE